MLPRAPLRNRYEGNMKKNLLLTVGDDSTSLFEVDFINSFFRNKADLRVTLFSILTPAFSYPSACRRDGRIGSNSLDDNRLNALDTCRTLLLSPYLTEDRISTKVVNNGRGSVENIIMEAQNGLYDAVMLGRQDYTLFEEYFALSTTREILQQEICVPVWICRHPEAGRRNVLLCVDESQNSMRAADHVGFFLRDEDEHTVTIFHVGNGEQGSFDEVLERVRRKLNDNGVSNSRIESKIIYSPRAIKSIVDEAVRGAYAVVALGHRRRFRPDGFKDWFIGSRCMKLLEAVDKAVLWACQ